MSEGAWRPWTDGPTADDIPAGLTTWAGHTLTFARGEQPCAYGSDLCCGGPHVVWAWVCSCGGQARKFWETEGGASYAWRHHLIRAGTIEHLVRERPAPDAPSGDLARAIAEARTGGAD